MGLGAAGCGSQAAERSVSIQRHKQLGGTGTLPHIPIVYAHSSSEGNSSFIGTTANQVQRPPGLQTSLCPTSCSWSERPTFTKREEERFNVSLTMSSS
ncbi:hypothetical protein EYF80_034010 [Liparis tanakae]|uniref:Uncharacterized protein n=1 Tax=Liparis tanakae TaxID=230148 RepID=A0A4Z2GSR3_9TELE|nr:hypothetical protein EYF80_034010 [Liparis tanakae]